MIHLRQSRVNHCVLVYFSLAAHLPRLNFSNELLLTLVMTVIDQAGSRRPASTTGLDRVTLLFLLEVCNTSSSSLSSPARL